MCIRTRIASGTLSLKPNCSKHVFERKRHLFGVLAFYPDVANFLRISASCFFSFVQEWTCFPIVVVKFTTRQDLKKTKNSVFCGIFLKPSTLSSFLQNLADGCNRRILASIRIPSVPPRSGKPRFCDDSILYPIPLTLKQNILNISDEYSSSEKAIDSGVCLASTATSSYSPNAESAIFFL